MRLAALRPLDSRTLLFIRSAVQALACVGTAEDIKWLQPLPIRDEAVLSSDVQAAIAHIEHRAKPLETLLAEVNGKSSFIALARSRRNGKTLPRWKSNARLDTMWMALRDGKWRDIHNHALLSPQLTCMPITMTDNVGRTCR